MGLKTGEIWGYRVSPFLAPTEGKPRALKQPPWAPLSKQQHKQGAPLATIPFSPDMVK